MVEFEIFPEECRSSPHGKNHQNDEGTCLENHFCKNVVSLADPFACPSNPSKCPGKLKKPVLLLSLYRNPGPYVTDYSSRKSIRS